MIEETDTFSETMAAAANVLMVISLHAEMGLPLDAKRLCAGPNYRQLAERVRVFHEGGAGVAAFPVEDSGRSEDAEEEDEDESKGGRSC